MLRSQQILSFWNPLSNKRHQWGVWCLHNEVELLGALGSFGCTPEKHCNSHMWLKDENGGLVCLFESPWAIEVGSLFSDERIQRQKVWPSMGTQLSPMSRRTCNWKEECQLIIMIKLITLIKSITISCIFSPEWWRFSCYPKSAAFRREEVYARSKFRGDNVAVEYAEMCDCVANIVVKEVSKGQQGCSLQRPSCFFPSSLEGSGHDLLK